MTRHGYMAIGLSQPARLSRDNVRALGLDEATTNAVSRWSGLWSYDLSPQLLFRIHGFGAWGGEFDPERSKVHSIRTTVYENVSSLPTPNALCAPRGTFEDFLKLFVSVYPPGAPLDPKKVPHYFYASLCPGAEQEVEKIIDTRKLVMPTLAPGDRFSLVMEKPPERFVVYGYGVA